MTNDLGTCQNLIFTDQNTPNNILFWNLKLKKYVIIQRSKKPKKIL